MSEKFIDLCVDDNNSAYGNDMPQRQERFRAHLEKLNFRFETTCLDLPNSTASSDAEVDIEAIKTADTTMGQDLDAIFEMIDGQAKEQFKSHHVII